MGKVATENTLKDIKTLLEYMLCGGRKGMYADISAVAAFIRSHSLDVNKAMFPVGDRLTLKWKDPDDAGHDTDETAWSMDWIIAHHAMVTLGDGRSVPGMYLMASRALPFSIETSAPQAAYHADTALAPGAYSIRMGASVSGAYAAGELAEFTLTQPLPAGGRIYIAPKSGGAYAVSTYALNSAAALETVSGAIVEASQATYLGATNDGVNNTVNRMRYGDNRWGASALRQYLNGRGANWYVSSDNFDLPPSYVARKGFMTGFDQSFLDAVRPVRQLTLLNSDSASGSATEETFDRFFLPSLEQLNVEPEVAGAEGEAFDYWKNALGLDGFAARGSGGVSDAFGISALGQEGIKRAHTRSAVLSSQYRMYRLSEGRYISAATSGTSCCASTPSYPLVVCAVC